MKKQDIYRLYLLGYLQVFILSGFSLLWILTPIQAAYNAFGAILTEQNYYFAYVKGIENILTAIILLYALRYKDRRLLLIGLTIAMIVYVTDIIFDVITREISFSILFHAVPTLLGSLSMYLFFKTSEAYKKNLN
jgi:hypothetical protein